MPKVFNTMLGFTVPYVYQQFISKARVSGIGISGYWFRSTQPTT